MKLRTYLTSHAISEAEFAAAIGVAKATVNRYVNGTRVPDRGAMSKIFDKTAGQVTPNDFYELAEPQDAACSAA